MKTSIRAARDDAAQKRIVAAAEELAGRFGLDVPERVYSQPRGSVAEMAMHQREALADLLEELVGVLQLPQVKTDDLQAMIDQATDEELLALPGIGPVTVERLRGE